MGVWVVRAWVVRVLVVRVWVVRLQRVWLKVSKVMSSFWTLTLLQEAAEGTTPGL